MVQKGKRFIRHTTPHFMAYFADIFFAKYVTLLGWHVCRTKLPPDMFSFDTEKGLKNEKKRSEKRPQTCQNNFKLLSRRLTISQRHFSKKQFTTQNLHKNKNYSPRRSAEMATLKYGRVGLLKLFSQCVQTRLARRSGVAIDLC